MAKTDFTVMNFRVTTSSATAAFHDIRNFVDEFEGLEVMAELQESHAMGDTWAEQLYTGLNRVSPIVIRGFYDDAAASGPHAIFGQTTDLGAERVVKINFGTTNAYPKTDVLVRRYQRLPRRGELTRYEVELLPTGALTVVTT